MKRANEFVFRDSITSVIATALFLFATSLMATPAKPNFSGHWELNKSQSDFGGGPTPENVVETIEHKEPMLVITTITKTARGEQNRTVKLTTDDVENSNLLNGHPMTTHTHWDGNKLVTVVKDPRGLQITEIRELSKDGRTQAVSIDTGFAKQKLMMLKK